MDTSSQKRLSDRLQQLEAALRRGARRAEPFVFGLPGIAASFILASVISGLILYYSNKKRYTGADGKLIFRDLFFHSLIAGAAVGILAAGGVWLYRKYVM